MKKLFALLLTVLTMVLCLTACKGDVDVLSNVGGDVLSGNGTFAVEKGDYLYFVNGIASDYDNNEMGDVQKGALYRVKTNEIGEKDATVEVVIPKLITTSSATNGVFIYGDTVYYASHYDEKDKTGTVRSDYTDFRYFDLTDADSERIAYESNTVNKYQFVKNGNNVYLVYEYSYTEDSVQKNKLKVLNASNGEEVYSVEGYSSILLADDLSSKIFFAKGAYSEQYDEDEAFSEIYCYTVGNSSADLIFSGCGHNDINSDNRSDESYSSKIISKYTDFLGSTFNLIKNTGKILVFKLTSIDTSSATCYFGINVSDGLTVDKLVELGTSNTYTDTAIANTSYFKSLNEIYYVENSTYLKGLVKFDYTKLDDSDLKRGRTLISSDVAGYNIATVDGDDMYLCGSAGDYYKVDLTAIEGDAKKVNAIKAKGITEWFVPRIVNGKFICVYSDAIYQNYLYAIDLENIDDTEEDADGKTAYEKYLESLSELDRDKVIALNETIVGKMTDGDKEAYQTALDDEYPVEEETEAE